MTQEIIEGNKIETFLISCEMDNGDAYLETREGRRITIAAVPCFTHSEIEESIWGNIEWFKVSHLETGQLVARDLSFEAAINKAHYNLTRPIAAMRIMEARKLLKAHKIDLPVNV